MARMIVSDITSTGDNHAVLEDGQVKVVLNEETKRKGYMPISEAKAFALSIITAMFRRDQMQQENTGGSDK